MIVIATNPYEHPNPKSCFFFFFLGGGGGGGGVNKQQ